MRYNPDGDKQLQAAGVEPHAGREDVRCVVLGRGADLARVAHWLKIAAPIDGYVGLAIGRTIWLDALSEHLAGRLEREAAIAQIAANYRQMIDTYAAAAVGRRSQRDDRDRRCG